MSRCTRRGGFTLVEMAVVLVLIGIVMNLGLKMVTATLENAAYSETKAKMERIKLAFVAYLRTNGSLPCPDNSDNTVVATGTAAASCNANAPEGFGIVPFQTLGLPRESALDGWGNYFTYRVANGVASKNWTAKASPATDLTIKEIKTQTPALTVQELDAAGTALMTTTDKAVVVILSHGVNGFGAKTTKVAARIPTADAGAGELVNATSGSSTFVLRPVNAAAGAFNGSYDDLMTYMLPQDLLQPLLSEGSVKVCAAYCVSGSASVCMGPGVCTCTGAGLPGVPDATNPCSGPCGTCVTQQISSTCSPTGPIPIGATPPDCT